MSDNELERRSFELMEAVHDQASFLEFLAAFVAEREAAETLERERPEYFRLGGAMNWQNTSISMFLESAAEYFTEGAHRFEGTEPSWLDIAQFLWFGKIYE